MAEYDIIEKMTGPQILYGRRDGELVHIDDVQRGQACGCTCPACGRPLVARKGEVLSHFFAHATDDVNCNPTPESLVHAYAKQQVGKLRRLDLPGFDVHAQYQSNDGELHEMFWRHRPLYSMVAKEAEVESTRFSGVKPDILFLTDPGFVAVEVFYRHAVPPEKLYKLTKELALSTLEIDLSDLPPNASSAMIDAALKQLSRWTWLYNGCKVGKEYVLQKKLAYSKKILIPETPSPEPRIAGSTVPSRLMTDASSNAYTVKAQSLVSGLRQLPPAERPALLRPLSREMRLALHCLQIGLKPAQLPPHLMQTVTRQSVFGVPTILWQTGLFAKFCMVSERVTAKQAAFWLRTVFPSMVGAAHTEETANGFNEYSEATHNFFNALSAQGLLRVIKGGRPWEAEFVPVAASKVEVLQRLLALPSALILRKH